MIIFPCDPIKIKLVDPEFKEEFNIAKQVGFPIILFDFDLFNSKSELKITNKINMKASDKKFEYSVLRSWMLFPEKYTMLYRSFHTRNITLINTPSQYENAHYFPNIYPYISDYTPKTTWMYQKELYVDKPVVLSSLREKIKNIGDFFIIKDFAKSNKKGDQIEKYSQNINLSELYKTIETFIKERKLYANFYEGIVFKEFINLKKYNNKVNEWRLFILDGKIISHNLNSNAKLEDVNKPDITKYENIFKKIPINFFTIDIAEQENGEWIIIEAGDGQVSGLAVKENAIGLINNLKNKL